MKNIFSLSIETKTSIIKWFFLSLIALSLLPFIIAFITGQIDTTPLN